MYVSYALFCPQPSQPYILRIIYSSTSAMKSSPTPGRFTSSSSNSTSALGGILGLPGEDPYVYMFER